MKKINVLNYAAGLTLLAMLSLASAVFVLPVLAGNVLAAEAKVAAQSLESRWVFSSDRWRRYWVQVPPDYAPADPTPVVVGFHGGFGNARYFAKSNSLAQASAERGYLAVFPEGTRRPWPGPSGRFWNSGNCCGIAMQEDVDDVQFFHDLLDDLSAEFNINPARVYATGMSNGAMMSYRLALEASDLLAAIAPVAGAVGLDSAPSMPVPVVAFHGFLEERVPFWGGIGTGFSGTDFFSQVDSIGPFFDANQCDLLSSTKEVIGNAVHYFLPSLTGHDISYWLLQDGGHSWPGSFHPTEPVNNDIDASEVMLDFFDAHVQP